MKIVDFEYDGIRLSDYGYMLVTFDGKNGLNTLSNGSKIQLNTISTHHKTKDYSISYEYSEPLNGVWQISKSPCEWDDNLEINYDELRSLGQWLCRDKFLTLSLKNESYEDFETKAYFNMSVLELDDKIYGIELTVTTNSPFLYLKEKEIDLDLTGDNSAYKYKHQIDSKYMYSDDFRDLSDVYGSKYPDEVKITLKQSGNLEIMNLLEPNRVISFNNCKENEVITLEYPMIFSNDSEHHIANDFNWNFIRINKNKESLNLIVSNIPVNIKIRYSPAIRVGLI